MTHNSSKKKCFASQTQSNCQNYCVTHEVKANINSGTLRMPHFYQPDLLWIFWTPCCWQTWFALSRICQNVAYLIWLKQTTNRERCACFICSVTFQNNVWLCVCRIICKKLSQRVVTTNIQLATLWIFAAELIFNLKRVTPWYKQSCGSAFEVKNQFRL